MFNNTGHVICLHCHRPMRLSKIETALADASTIYVFDCSNCGWERSIPPQIEWSSGARVGESLSR